MNTPKKKFKIDRIVTGGQTGSDRAAMDFAIEMQIPLGGWCPEGRYAEDGPIDSRYPLVETPSKDVAQRTEWNVRDSDGTLILTHGEITDGTLLTINCAKKYSRPHLVHPMATVLDRRTFEDWLHTYQIKVLNIAGPRESHAPGVIYTKTLSCLRLLLSPP